MSKLYKLYYLVKDFGVLWTTSILTTHSSSCAYLSLVLPAIGITLTEYLYSQGLDCLICFDDLSKHAKAFRQISLILGKTPSRDAFPADIFNVHSSLLERSASLSNIFGGSITAFPIIETVNSDITEFIATNVISITDGQIYTSKSLFIDSLRPAIDSGLSVSRIGSAAQCGLMKDMAGGVKNLLTTLRTEASSLAGLNKVDAHMLSLFNGIFTQQYLCPSTIPNTILLLMIVFNLEQILKNCNLEVLNFKASYYSGFYIIYMLTIGYSNSSPKLNSLLQSALKLSLLSFEKLD